MLSGAAELSEGRSPEAIDIPLPCSGLCEKMFGYFQRRRRPLTTQTKRPTEGGHARNAGSRRWLTIATGPGLENQSNCHGFLELDEVVIG